MNSIHSMIARHEMEKQMRLHDCKKTDILENLVYHGDSKKCDRHNLNLKNNACKPNGTPNVTLNYGYDNLEKKYNYILAKYGVDPPSLKPFKSNNRAKMPTIAIIGGGWYGCHLAKVLSMNKFSVKIFEANDDLFTQASAKNTFRLHQGFHYPRNHTTRSQCKRGFQQFLNYYPALVRDQSSAVYAISNKSQIDFMTYQHIMSGSRLPYTICKSSPIRYQYLQGMINTQEKTIYVDLPRLYFKSSLTALDVDISYHTRVDSISNNDNGKVNVSYVNHRLAKVLRVQTEETFDYVLNCTYNTFDSIQDIPTIYESCIQFIYCINKRRQEKPFSFSIFDGPDHPSIDPFQFYFEPDCLAGKQLFIMSHVSLTPMQKYSSYSDAVEHQSNLSDKEISFIRNEFKEKFSEYFPNFIQDFSYIGHVLSIKSKPYRDYNSDFRGVITEQDGGIIRVFSGKVDTIFQASHDVLALLHRKQ